MRPFIMILAAATALGAALARAEDTSSAAPSAVAGPFQPDWQSLESQYQCPDWFRDAKFGIWAHWSAQCQPEQGDWYARSMYMFGSNQNKFHVATYGHPSKVGFKDVCNLWKAEKFDPDKLIALYKRAGAKYFVALANHHCNFDCFDSKYQPWNSVQVGPKQDLVGLWAAAARKAGLRFGVTVHAGRSWSWYEVAQGSDPSGPLAGRSLRRQADQGRRQGPVVGGPRSAGSVCPEPQDRATSPTAAYCEKFSIAPST